VRQWVDDSIGDTVGQKLLTAIYGLVKMRSAYYSKSEW